MATLQKIRNKAGLLVGIVGVALFAFVIGDGLRSGSTFFRQTKETVMVVDGQSVNINDYVKRLSELTDIYSMQSNGTNLPEERQAQLRNEVFENFVREMLINEEADKVGFSVTSDEVFDMIQGEHVSPMIQQMTMFQNEQGQFDRAALMRFLQIIETQDFSNFSEQERIQIDNSRKYWLFLEKNLQQQRMEEKFSNIISKIIVANPLDVKAEFEDNRVSVDIDYIQKSYASIPDSLVVVSDSEIKKLYDKRKELYKQEPAVELKYIEVKVEPSDADYAEVERAIEKLKPEMLSGQDVFEVVNESSDVQLYDAYASAAFLSADAKKFVEEAQIGDVKGPVLIGNTYHIFKYLGKMIAPDSVHVNEITMPMLAEKELKHLTDSLVGVVKNGKPFAELASELMGGRSNGDLGWLTDEMALRRFDNVFRNAIYDAKVNDVFVLKTSRGTTHIVQVTEKTTPVAKYKVADLAMEVNPSNTTTTNAFTKLNQYVLKNNTLSKFESEASSEGYLCQRITLDPNEQMFANIPSTRSLVQWAFKHKKGEISDVTECDGYKYVVAMVDNKLEKGYRPASSVSEYLKQELIRDKKAEKIIADIQAKNCTSLEACGTTLDLPVQSVKFLNFGTNRITGIGTEPVLNAVAPLSEVNKMSKPVKGNLGVYIFKVTDKHESNTEFNLERQKQMMDSQNAYRYMYQSVRALRDNANVEDYRIRFY